MNGKQRMARQSKQWLVDALVTLMKDEAIEDISITEIVQTADLSRRTFYRAFKTKDDLIDYLCRQLADDYFKSLKAATRDQTPISLATTTQKLFHILVATKRPCPVVDSTRSVRSVEWRLATKCSRTLS